MPPIVKMPFLFLRFLFSPVDRDEIFNDIRLLMLWQRAELTLLIAIMVYTIKTSQAHIDQYIQENSEGESTIIVNTQDLDEMVTDYWIAFSLFLLKTFMSLAVSIKAIFNYNADNDGICSSLAIAYFNTTKFNGSGPEDDSKFSRHFLIAQTLATIVLFIVFVVGFANINTISKNNAPELTEALQSGNDMEMTTVTLSVMSAIAALMCFYHLVYEFSRYFKIKIRSNGTDDCLHLLDSCLSNVIDSITGCFSGLRDAAQNATDSITGCFSGLRNATQRATDSIRNSFALQFFEGQAPRAVYSDPGLNNTTYDDMDDTSNNTTYDDMNDTLLNFN